MKGDILSSSVRKIGYYSSKEGDHDEWVFLVDLYNVFLGLAKTIKNKNSYHIT